MSDYHLSVEVPGDATPDERKALIASAYRQALSDASGSARMRLQMILGEAYRKFVDVATWIAEEIRKDEAGAPNLIALANAVAATDAITQLFAGTVPIEVVEAQDILLAEAVRQLQTNEPPLLEHQECTELTPTISGSGS